MVVGSFHSARRAITGSTAQLGARVASTRSSQRYRARSPRKYTRSDSAPAFRRRTRCGRWPWYMPSASAPTTGRSGSAPWPVSAPPRSGSRSPAVQRGVRRAWPRPHPEVGLAMTTTSIRPPVGTQRLLGTQAQGWHEHVGLVGPVPRLTSEQLLALVQAAGLTGRGGAGFPTARKIAAIAAIRRTPVVVGNAMEGEFLSHKDRTLLEVARHSSSTVSRSWAMLSAPGALSSPPVSGSTPPRSVALPPIDPAGRPMSVTWGAASSAAKRARWSTSSTAGRSAAGPAHARLPAWCRRSPDPREQRRDPRSAGSPGAVRVNVVPRGGHG